MKCEVRSVKCGCKLRRVNPTPKAFQNTKALIYISDADDGTSLLTFKNVQNVITFDIEDATKIGMGEFHETSTKGTPEGAATSDSVAVTSCQQKMRMATESAGAATRDGRAVTSQQRELARKLSERQQRQELTFTGWKNNPKSHQVPYAKY